MYARSLHNESSVWITFRSLFRAIRKQTSMSIPNTIEDKHEFAINTIIGIFFDFLSIRIIIKNREANPIAKVVNTIVEIFHTISDGPMADWVRFIAFQWKENKILYISNIFLVLILTPCFSCL